MARVTSNIVTVWSMKDRTGAAYKNMRKNLRGTQTEMMRFAQTMGVFAGGVGVARLSKALVTAAIDMEGLRSQFKAATGNISGAASEMEFARKVADDMGLQFDVTAGRYAKLIAASQGIGISQREVRDVFLGVSMASRALYLSTDQTAGALRAIEQVMSKGTVQAEELRGQLGERLPGAFNLAAQALGYTTAELNKMLQQGKVLAKDLIPKLGKELQKIYGSQAHAAAATAIGDFARLHNAMFQIKAYMGSALMPGLSTLTKMLEEKLPAALAATIVTARTTAAGFLTLAAGVYRVVEGIQALGVMPTPREQADALKDQWEDLLAEKKRFERKIHLGIADPNIQADSYMRGLDARIAETERLLKAKMESLKWLESEMLMGTAKAVMESAEGAAVHEELTGRQAAYVALERENVLRAEEKAALEAAGAAHVKYTQSLTSQLATFGASKAEMLEYTIRMKELAAETPEAAAEIRGLGDALLEMMGKADYEKMRAGVNDFVGKLADQNAELLAAATGTEELYLAEKQLAELRAMGGNRKDAEKVRELREEQAKLKDQVASKEYLDALEEQVMTWGMTAQALDDYNTEVAVANAATPELVANIRALAEARRAFREGDAAEEQGAKDKEFMDSLRDQITGLRAVENGTERAFAIKKKLDAWYAQGGSEEEAEAVRKLAGEYYDLQEQQKNTFDHMQSIQDEAARSMFQAWEQFFFDPMGDGLDGLLKSFIQVIRKMIAQELAYRTISMFNFSGFFDGILGKRAKGGPVLSGGSYIVGEKGPELFTPATSGMITPNHALGLGGGPSVVINQSIDARGATTDLVAALPGILYEQNERTKAEISDLLRRGLFAR